MIIYYTDNYTGGRGESHRLLAEALALYTGDRESAGTLVAAMKKGEHGKPYIEGSSCFSISHTGRIWAVLFDECECGLDIQLSRKCDAMAIARRIFADEDVQWLQTLSSQDAEKARKEFFRLWTRRESLVKALGGSVTDSGLPSVLNKTAVLGGREYSIEDAGLPELPIMGEDKLYCAICFDGNSEDRSIEFRCLPLTIK